MARNTDKDWQQIAQDEPYWGVLSVDDYMSSRLTPEAREAFFKSGEIHVANLLATVRRHLAPEFQPRRVLDFGCGVGRLTIPFAKIAQEAVGIDVAPRMLELCRQNAAQAGVANLKAVASDDELSQVDGMFDLINSHIVLQHIDPARGTDLIERLLCKLEIGGIASLQLTYGKSRRFWQHEAPKARFYRRDGDMIKDLGVVNDARPPGTVTMYDYDLNQVMAVICQYAGSPLIALPTSDDDHLGMQILLKKAR